VNVGRVIEESFLASVQGGGGRNRPELGLLAGEGAGAYRE
jgi:hypothetical protein